MQSASEIKQLHAAFQEFYRRQVQIKPAMFKELDLLKSIQYDAAYNLAFMTTFRKSAR